MSARWTHAGVVQLVAWDAHALDLQSDLHVVILCSSECAEAPTSRGATTEVDVPILEVARRALTTCADWTACVHGSEAAVRPELVASSHDTAATAHQHALTLALTVTLAPQTGARNTTRLLRYNEPRCTKQPRRLAPSTNPSLVILQSDTRAIAGHLLGTLRLRAQGSVCLVSLTAAGLAAGSLSKAIRWTRRETASQPARVPEITVLAARQSCTLRVTETETAIVSFRCKGLTRLILSNVLAHVRPACRVHLFFVGRDGVDRSCVAILSQALSCCEQPSFAIQGSPGDLSACVDVVLSRASPTLSRRDTVVEDLVSRLGDIGGMGPYLRAAVPEEAFLTMTAIRSVSVAPSAD